jgi:hypothetical protein
MKRDGLITFILICFVLIAPVGLCIGVSPPKDRINILIVTAIILIALWRFLDDKPISRKK